MSQIPMTSATEIRRVTVTEEFQKNPDLTQKDLDELRQWLKTQQHLPEMSDTLLIMVHHSCYFDLNRTKDTIEHYYTKRTNAPEYFTNRDVTSPDLSKAWHVMNIVTLPVPDPQGCWINYHGLRDTEPKNFVALDALKLVLMSFEANGVKYGTVPGYYVIYDMKGFMLKHLTRCSLQLIRKFASYSEKGLPIRKKEVHLVNAPFWISKLVAIIKSLISKATADNIHIHTGDMKTLHTHIPKECLPKELGGSLESLEVLKAATYLNLEVLRDYFAEEEKMRVDKSHGAKHASEQNIEELEDQLENLKFTEDTVINS